MADWICDQAVLRQIAAHYRESKYNFIAFLDGDKRLQKTMAIRTIKQYLETRYYQSESEFDLLISNRLNYLPGEKWPEKEIISTLYSALNLSNLERIWDECKSDLSADLEQCLSSEKHSEFYDLSQKVSMPLEQVRIDAIRQYKEIKCAEINGIEEAFRALLR